MNCSACGKENPADAQFCGVCGASLSTSTPIGVGAASSEPPTDSFPKTIKRNHHRRIKPWMWIVSVGLPLILFVGIWIVLGLMMTGALGCPEPLCQDWGQVSRGDSYAEEGQYEMAIQEYDEAIRLERDDADAYYKRGLAHEALGKTKEARRDFESAIQEYDETIRTSPYAYPYYQRALTYKALGMTIEAERDFESAIQEYDEAIRLDPQAGPYYYNRGVAHEALGKTLEAERDFAKAKELGYEP